MSKPVRSLPLKRRTNLPCGGIPAASWPNPLQASDIEATNRIRTRFRFRCILADPFCPACTAVCRSMRLQALRLSLRDHDPTHLGSGQRPKAGNVPACTGALNTTLRNDPFRSVVPPDESNEGAGLLVHGDYVCGVGLWSC